MRQIFPLGDYVRRTGDAMTGVLTIKRDSTGPADPHLILQNATATAPNVTIGYMNEAGTLQAVVQFIRGGYIQLVPGPGYPLRAPWNTLGGIVHWRPFGFPMDLFPRRVMMVESEIFGGE